MAGAEWAMGRIYCNECGDGREQKFQEGKRRGSGEVESWSPGDRAWTLFKVQMEVKEQF